MRSNAPVQAKAACIAAEGKLFEVDSHLLHPMRAVALFIRTDIICYFDCDAWLTLHDTNEHGHLAVRAPLIDAHLAASSIEFDVNCCFYFKQVGAEAAPEVLDALLQEKGELHMLSLHRMGQVSAHAAATCRYNVW